MRHPPARRHLSLPVAGTPPLPSLNAVAATGLGTTYNTQRAFSNWEVQISTTASPTFSVQLQGSLGGQTIINIGSPITATGLTNVTSNTPLTMVALNLTALSGGTLTGTIAGTEAPAGAGGGGGGGAVTQSTGAGAAAPWSVELSDGTAFYTAAKTGQLPAALVGNRVDVNIGATGVTQPVSGTVTGNQGTANTAANAWPAKVTDGTNVAAVKAASTAAVATDPAAVVTLSPNTALPAGANALGSVTVTGTSAVSGTVTANQGTQGAGGTASWQVQGAAAVGAAAVGSPVLIGGTDVANAGVVRTFLTDGSGRLIAIGGGTSTDGIGNTSTGIFVLPQTLAYNGTGWDRTRNNVDVTLLASAARTTTQPGSNITAYNCQALIVTLDVTAITATCSLTVTINYIDPASGKSITLLTSAVIAAVSTTMWVVDPRVVAAANLVANKAIGRVFTITVTVGNANSQTYSLGYTLVPC